MTQYRIRLTGEVKTQGEIRKMHPNISLPKVWGVNVHQALSIDPVTPTEKPAPSGDFKVVVRNGVDMDSKSQWVWAWTEREMFTEYTDDEGNTVTVQAQKDAKIAADNAALAASERTKRDDLLKATDHYGLSDVTMSEAMTTYRQALRDVPQQTDFPGTITWPTKPE